MRHLILLRHAKSSWDDPSLDDFDRPLAPRGIEAAKRMGREIARRGWLPASVLVSPALRTRQTWELASAELPGTPTVEFRQPLYEATAATILAELTSVRKTTGTLLVIGHNPGMEDLARRLARDDSDPGALARLRAKFPTAALACFAFDDAWKGLGPRSARLTDFLIPKDLT